MIIEPIVLDTARHFGIDPALIQAVCNAEGDIVKAVKCSVPLVETKGEAVAILCRSAVHAMSDYVKANHGPAYVAFFGARWAPVGVANDPTGLNVNFCPNVLQLWAPPPPKAVA